tara:strand:+ start:12473 stop:12661 length:189 start_codon:yes stop_codon:yes gene_type:complete
MTTFQGHPIPRLEKLRKEQLQRELVAYLNRKMWDDAKRLMIAWGVSTEVLDKVIAEYKERQA